MTSDPASRFTVRPFDGLSVPSSVDGRDTLHGEYIAADVFMKDMGYAAGLSSLKIFQLFSNSTAFCNWIS